MVRSIFLLMISLVLARAEPPREAYLNWASEIKKLPGFKFHYQEKTIYESIDRINESEGEFYFMLPNYYRLETEDLEIFATSAFLWNYDKPNKQTIIHRRQGIQSPIELLIMSSDIDAFFSVDSIGKKSVDKKERGWFRLVRNEGAEQIPYSLIEIYYELKSKAPVLLIVRDENDTVTRVALTKFDRKFREKPEFFEYSKKIGVEEIKMY